jgi:amidase
MTVLEQVAALESGETSSSEIVAATLDAIEAAEPHIDAYKIIRREEALKEAAAADERRARGESGALLGVPVAIKDETNLSGYPTAFGCRGDWPVATEDSEMVRRIRGAGGIIVGKTHSPELGQWPFTEGYEFTVRNPWSLEHSPGGSSGGASATVASGAVAASFGADGAGSIRIPSAWTNLIGIKPQRGRISTYPAPINGFYGIAVYGPLSKTVADAAHLLDVATGNHPDDTYQPVPPAEPFSAAANRSPRRLRIALSFKVPFSAVRATVDPRIEASTRALAEVLANLGHEVIEADPDYGLLGASFLPRSMAGLHHWVKNSPDPSVLDPRTRGNARTGSILRGPALKAALASSGYFERRIGAIFDQVDVVLAPTTAQPPLPIGAAAPGTSNHKTDQVIIGACPMTWPWNVLGWPSINVPSGFIDGLPVGSQLMGPAASEALLISLAAELESTEKWFLNTAPALVTA